MKVLFVTSPGGHLAQLTPVAAHLGGHDRVWVTFDAGGAPEALAGERVIFAHYPTTRNVPNALRNLKLAHTVLRDERPDVVVSAGAGVAAPFFLAARAKGIRTVYLEVVDRVSSPTLTGRMVYPFVSEFLVQWPEQQTIYPDSTVVGRVI